MNRVTQLKTRRRPTVAIAIIVIAALMAVVITAGISPRVAPSYPPPPEGAILWSADMETGDVSQWTQGQVDEAVFNTGTGQISTTTEVAHSGTHSLKMSVTGASGETQAARILRWHDTPSNGYYSVWFLFPRDYHPSQWWNVMQFKSVGDANVPTFVLNVGNRSDGSMFFYLWDALTRTSYAPVHRVNIQTNHWTQVKAYLRRATDKTGRITIWQDGVLLFDLDQVQTAVGANIHFGIGNYTDSIVPSDPVIFADDAEIRSVISVSSNSAEEHQSGP